MRYAIWALVAVVALVGCAPDSEGADYAPPVPDSMPYNLKGQSFGYTTSNGDKVPCVLFYIKSGDYINVVCDWSRMYR